VRSESSRWVVWVLALATCLGGAWASLDLTVNHGRLPGRTRAQTSPATQPASAPAAQNAEAAVGASAGTARRSRSLLSQACEAIAWSDCEEASESPWAWFPFGVTNGPRIRTAALGLFFFTAMICWLVMVGWPSPSRAWVQIIPLMAAGSGLGMSILLEYVMWTRLSKPCLLCLLTHVASLLLFVFMVLLWPRRPRPVVEPVMSAAGPGRALPAPAVPEEAAPWPANWTLAVTPLVVLFFPVMLLLAASAAGGTSSTVGTGGGTANLAKVQEMRAAFERRLSRYEGDAGHAYTAWSQAARLNIATQGRPAKGPPDARHTVVIFSDFECPRCQDYEVLFHQQIVPLLNDPAFGGTRIVFKQWPICTDCNPHAVVNLHPAACEAARAAEAAFALGGDAAFWKMHDLLFERQAEWKEDRNFTRLAAGIGLDAGAFEQARRSEQVRERVKADVLEGEALGKELVSEGKLGPEERDALKVNSTPAVYLDGKRMVLPHHPEAWRRALAWGELSAYVAGLERQLKDRDETVRKRDETIQQYAKYHQKYTARYESRWEHTYLDWQYTRPVTIPIERRPTRGPEGARHTIVLFSDFECPGCKQFEAWLARSILPTGQSPTVGGIRLVFKQWPICTDCNPHATSNLHPVACQAALAAEAAFQIGGHEAFWRMHDLLFARQDEWKKTRNFGALAQMIGLNESDFVTAMNNPATLAAVQADVEDGFNLGKDLVTAGTITEDQRDFIKVESTPAIFVDGKRLWTPTHVKTWNQILGYVPRSRAATQPATGAPAQ